ncbi:hypothetical protein DL95DRAFT_399137, partial [Leptodontidium sp. 2 PMI_412]
MAEVHTANKQDGDDTSSESCISGSFEVVNMTHPQSTPSSGYGGHTASPEEIPSAVANEHRPKLPPRPYNQLSLDQMSGTVVRRPHPTSISTENPPSPLLCGDDARMVLEEYLAP